MRVIDRKIRDGIRALKSFKCGSSRLEVWYDANNDPVIDYYLHNNRIATITWNTEFGYHVLSLRDCGWRTKTTKDRMNGLLRTLGTNVGIYQNKFSWYVTNGVDTYQWNGHDTFNLEPTFYLGSK